MIGGMTGRDSVRVVTVDRGDAGRRLDLVVRRHVADIDIASRTRIQRWIERGDVSINGVAVRRAATRANAGDVVAIALPGDLRARRTEIAAEPISIEVLYEDDHLLAVDKPGGLIVHPSYGHANGTLMNALLWRAQAWPRPQRPSVVGRLDKLTSGIVLVAKTAADHAALQRALASRLTSKEYVAVVYGRPRPVRGTIDLRLRHDPDDRRRIIASPSLGLESITRYERLDVVTVPRTAVSLVDCRLMTGRTHQIRVHLAASGWPIVGDAKYGEPIWSKVVDPAIAGTLQTFPRQALHARRLAFTHPATKERLQIDAPVPPDMRRLIDEIGLRSGLAEAMRDGLKPVPYR
jgi:23S rRNA pseudouridine1911/1915/1917 synthase